MLQQKGFIALSIQKFPGAENVRDAVARASIQLRCQMQEFAGPAAERLFVLFAAATLLETGMSCPWNRRKDS